MDVQLRTKEIKDLATRDNFEVLRGFLNSLQILDGYWNFFEVDLSQAGSGVAISHRLDFVPQDIILLSILGDQKVVFHYNKFDAQNIYLTNRGPAVVRFLAGRYQGKAYGGLRRDYPFVAP